jgi:TalC/MipB family fructose-6-phosphate aldolase
VPFTREGVKACKTLSSEGTPVNVTLIFSATQALLAAKVGASYVSPFVGRLDDIATDGMHLIEEIVEIFDNYEFGTEGARRQLPPPDSHRHRGEAGRRHLHVPARGARSAVQAPADRHRAGEVPEGLGEVAGGGTLTNDE